MGPFQMTAWMSLMALAVTVPAGCRVRESASVKAIVFDVGGVLSDDIIDTKLGELAALYNLDARSLLSVKSRYRDPAELGQISDSDFWIRILGHFGVEAGEEDAEIDSYMEPLEGSLDIARSLSGTYRVAILSNDSRERGALRREKFGFDKIFDPIIISGDVGARKPGLEIYRLLLEQLGTPAGECLFVDDDPDNVQAAEEAGMRTILFENAGQLRKELLAHGVRVEGRGAVRP